MKNYVIRLNQLTKILGMSRSTIWRRMKSDPSFPRTIKLGQGEVAAVGFLSNEVDEWVALQAKNRDLKK